MNELIPDDLAHADECAQLRLLLDAVNQGVATLAADGTVITTNRRMSDLLGAPDGPLAGAALANHLPEVHRAEFAHALAQALTQQTEAEVRVARGPGQAPLLVTLHALPRALSPDLCRGEASPPDLCRDRLDGDASPLPVELPRLGNAPGAAISVIVTELHEDHLRRELDASASFLRESRLAALNVIEDALQHRDRADRARAALEREVAERKRIEAALRLSEQRFRVALNNSPITVATLDRDLRYTWVYNTRHGFSSEKVLGKRPDELLPPEDTAELTALLERVLETGVVERCEVSGRARGQMWVYDVTAEPTFDEHGAVTGLTIANIDIADRRQVEDDLRRARAELEQRVEERTHELAQANQGLRAEIAERKRAERQIRLLSAAMEAAANGILIADRQGAIEWCNPALAHMTGYNAVELIGQSPHIFQSGRQDRDFYARFWSVILSGQIWHGEIVNRRADGSLYTEEQTVTPMLDDEGKITHFIAIKQDVTERKQAEARLEQNNRDLQILSEAEHRARQVAEILATANRAFTQTLDLDTVTETLLEYVQQLVPYDSACVILLEGESRPVMKAARGYERWNDLTNVLAPVFDVTSNPIARALVQEQTSVVMADTRLDPDWPRIPGAERIRSWLGVPVRVAGKVIGLCGLDKAQPGFFTPDHRRLAELLVGQAAIAIQNAWLFEQVRAGRERLAALSHRLVQVQDAERAYIARELHDEAGQLLTSLLVGLRLLKDDANESEAVVAGVDELSHMVEDVLSGLHRLAVDLRPASLDHLGLLAALRQHLDSLARKHHLKVRFDATGFGGIGDERLTPDAETTLYRFVQEALTNVIRHAQATQVEVRLERRARRVRAVVTDNGIGFDQSASLAAGPSPAGGEGQEEHLGLFGMRERAGMLGGTLSVESAPGAGTSVIMEVSSDNDHNQAHPRPDHR